jgi:putative ABC transport system permease protein
VAGNENLLRPRWRKVLADLWDNKMRTILVVASIAVGVFAVGTVGTSFAVLSEDMRVSYNAARPAAIEIWSDPFDEDHVRSIEKVPGVEEAEGRNIFNVRVRRGNDSWLAMDFVAIDDFETSDIFLRVPIEGEQTPGRRELVIERNLLGTLDVQVGDVLQVRLPDDTVREMPVVGITQDQSAASAGFNASPMAFISADDLEWLGRSKDLNRLLARVSGGINDEDVVREVSVDIENKIEKSGLQSYRTQLYETQEHPMASTVQAVLGVLAALGVLIMLLSGSLIMNTLNALLKQHMRQIGVMKLVGARSYQIMGMYVALILSFGVIALIIAIPLGAIAGYALAEFMASLLNIPLQGFRVVPAVVVLQIMGGLLVPLVAGFIPVRSGSNTTVRRAISDHGLGEQTSNAGWLDRLGSRLTWLSRPVLLSIRNTFRRKGRLILTLFTLTMGGGIFIAVFNVQASMQQFLDEIGQLFIADVTLSFERPYRVSAVEQAVFQVPGVEAIEQWSAASAEVLDEDDSLVENVLILAPPAESELVEAEMMAGRWILPGDQKALVISDAVWDTYPDLQPGDTLPLKLQGLREDDWTVVGVFRFSGQLGDWLGYTDYEYLSRLQNTPNKAASYRVVSEGHTLEEQEAVGRALDEHLQAQGFKVTSAEAGLVTLREAAESINVLVSFLLMMALLTALVGSIGLAGTMGMNVLERTREIGVMRAIGAVDLEIIKTVVVEGVLIGIISWVLAVALSFPITFLLLRMLAVAFSAPLPAVFVVQGSIIWLLVVLALSVIASVIPARNAARLTIREVLAYE